MNVNIYYWFGVSFKNKIWRYFFCALIPLLSQVVSADTIYVDDLSDGQQGTGTEVDPYRDLQVAINAANSGDVIEIKAGLYSSSRTFFADPTCGNCGPSDFEQNAQASYGFLILGKSLTIKGESQFETTLVTNAGYGVFFDGAGTSTISNLRITGGKRDTDANATDGAIVAKNTALTVRNLDIYDNNDELPGRVEGLAGIVGREGTRLAITNVTINNISWDGIALYQSDPGNPGSNVVATVENVSIIGGRGAGIGVTWDANATIKNVEVSGFWKGVGAFGSADVKLFNSIIRNNRMWGVLADGAAKLYAVNNVVAGMGKAGMHQYSYTAEVTFINNIVFGNGHDLNDLPDEEDPLGGVVISNSATARFEHNNVYQNTVDFCRSYDCIPGSFIGIAGNISQPVTFSSTENMFELSCDSPGIDLGSPGIVDLDLTRSDMGLYGGPHARIPPPACVDLTPLVITKSSVVVEEGIPVVFQSGVLNEGLAASGQFSANWYLDKVLQIAGVHSPVSAGAVIKSPQSKFVWNPTRGNHIVSYHLNGSNALLESDYTNNVASIWVSVIAPRPDLKPTDITFNPALLIKGKNVYFDSGISNSRPVATGEFNIKWYVDDVVVGHGMHKAIPANTTVYSGNSSFTWKAVPGVHVIKFEVDADGEINESNEFNNIRSVAVVVP